MKIRFLEDTNIRKLPRLDGNLPVGMMFKGSEIEVEPDIAIGDAIQDIDRWYHDRNGWYYWSGMAERVIEEEPPSFDPIGGIIVAPAPKEEHPEHAAEPPEDETPEEDTPGKEPIPEGETRLVPSLAVLLEKERRGAAGVSTLPKPVQELESTTASDSVLAEARGATTDSDLLAEARGVVTVMPPDGSDATPIPPPVSSSDPTARETPAGPALWQNPARQKLNWGVRDYLIAEDWWRLRKITGKGVTIAILSTGVEPAHPDMLNLAGQFAGADEQMSDRSGLGTQAAVIAAGCGQTVFGVAPEARILAVKLGDQDHLITPDSLIEGLNWAIDAGADIVAMLVDFPDLSVQQLEALQILINQAVDRHILLVAPAGTAENKKPESRYPARLTGVLSVGAHNQYGERSNFSARSYDLDIMAPGEGLHTSTPTRMNVDNLKSTSIAAAFVAGFMALIRQWQHQNNQPSTPAGVFDLLKETTVPHQLFNMGKNVEYGYGLLNPVKVLKALDPTYQGPAGT